MSAQSQVFDITPDQRTMRHLGATGEPAHKAIAELIDNAVDARPEGQLLTVEIVVKTKGASVVSVQVNDDGIGMTAEQLAKALKIGSSDKQVEALGKFGFGLKTAVSSLGSRWAIAANTVNCPYTWRVTSSDITGWKAEVSAEPRAAGHGTAIVVEGCDRLHAPTLLRDLTEGLGELYAHFIESRELSLYLNDEPVKLPELDLVEGSRRKLDFYVGKRRVTGWVGVRRFSSQRFGLNLVRNRRVIESMAKIGFPADGSFTRVIGELHLDEFAVDTHKSRFVKSGNDWQALLKELSPFLKPTLEASREAVANDKRKVHPELSKLLAEHTAKLVGAVQKLDGNAFLAKNLRVRKQVSFTATEKSTPVPTPAAPPAEPGDLNVQTVDMTPPKERAAKAPAPELNVAGLVGLPIRHEFSAGGLAGPAFVCQASEDCEGDRALRIIINTEHPAYVDGIQYPVAMRHTIEAVSQYIALQAAHAVGQAEPGLARYGLVLDRVRRVAADALLPVW
jgi:hypothetical protein